MLALAHLKKEEEEEKMRNCRIWPISVNHFAKVVEHRNMFWRLEKHAKTTANTQMQPKI